MNAEELLVEEYEMETEKVNGKWNINTSKFRTTKIFVYFVSLERTYH